MKKQKTKPKQKNNKFFSKVDLMFSLMFFREELNKKKKKKNFYQLA